MSANQYPRISPFWLDPAATLPHRNADRPVDRFYYATDGARVYRFRGRADREHWVKQDGTRTRLGFEHALVRAAKAADEWPKSDEDGV